MKKKILLIIVIVLIIAGSVFSHFGGFGTGESADSQELAKYAMNMEELSIPENTRIIALGEATHGNKEFQQLKLDVFQILVERYGIRGFALEADYGCCERVNRYIHGGEGTVKEATEALGFTIYKTNEMGNLIEWMRSFNETAQEGNDLRFYGFDMQRTDYNRQYLLEAAKAMNLDTSKLEQLSDSLSLDDKEAIYSDIKEQMLAAEKGQDIDVSIHFADILLQNIAIGKVYEENFAEANGVRDKYMADNTLWILEQEERRNNHMIFISAHNGHVEQFGTYVGGSQKVMGNLLADTLGKDQYYAIGTDFYKTTCNMPTSNGKRVTHTFYSHDPLAKAANMNDYDMCYLDFSKIPDDSSLSKYINDYIYMGNLGDNPIDGLNGIIFHVLPQAYRIWQCPSLLYDSLIIVTNAHPIVVNQ